MKTPMQELIEQLEKEYKKFYEDTDVPRWFYNNGIEQALKHAKSMLEKEQKWLEYHLDELRDEHGYEWQNYMNSNDT